MEHNKMDLIYWQRLAPDSGALPPPQIKKSDKYSEFLVERFYLKPELPEVYLTPREMDVARLLTKTLTCPQIAMQLELSTRTVEFYIKSLRIKLHCHDKRRLEDLIRNLTAFK